jgi:GH24 family phage-related lysozyme (muramidase)
MNIDEFKTLYNELYEDNMITEGRLLNSFLAGTALTAGTVLGLGKLSEVEKQEKSPVPIVQTVDKQSDMTNTDAPSTDDVETADTDVIESDNAWISSITIPFIIKWEGKITDSTGNHVLYDDNVKTKVKRRWDGKGGQAGIDRFIASCKGKPTIGYGETDPDIVRKGKISDNEARLLLEQRIKNLDKFLSEKYHYYNTMNPNQKTALISFSYNLGKHFIETGTVKLKAHLAAGRLNQMCNEMRDCDNVKQEGELVKVPGLTRRRQAEMRLFRTPY